MDRVDRELGRLLERKCAAIAAPPKTHVRSPQEQAEHEASEAFADGLRSSGESIRAFAKRVGKDESLIRAYISGAKVVPLAMLKRLNAAGQYAALRKCIATVPETSPIESDDDCDDEVRRIA